jgi:hypothetical protein
LSSIAYKHSMAAHCESGTVANLVNHHGLKISESLVFGIAGGIFFGYMKTPMREFPMVFSRIRPGKILENFTRRTGVVFKSQKFSDPDKAERELDHLLDQGQPVGLQVDFFYMDFFPPWHRVHINVHYIVAIGKEGDHYIISDCYHPAVAKLHRDSLRKGRFAKGSMAPKGLMFYPVEVPSEIALKKGVRKGLSNTVYNMLKIPIPFLGVKGIRRFGDKIVEWPGYAKDTEHLAHNIFMITTMLEDQGTGGAGFRYIYASFLSEAADVLEEPLLKEYARRMMEIGDDWRNVSLFASRIAKRRELGKDRLREMGELIHANADAEQAFFTDLRKTLAS